MDYAFNDAEAMKRYVIDVLGYREGNILDLRDATLGQLRDVFGTKEDHRGRLFDYVRDGISDVTVFYSGHGVPGLLKKRGYLLPVDGNPNKAENTAYSLDVLQANLAKLPARSVQLFLEACFSGNSDGGMLIQATSGISISPVLPGASDNFVMLTAASGDQVASWDRDAQLGIFTNHLLQALNGAADQDQYGNGDGEITLAEVEEYLDQEMTYRARRLWGRTQNADVTGDRASVLAILAPQRLRISNQAFRVTEMDAEFVTQRITNVRSQPTSRSRQLARLQPGSSVTVTGSVGEDANWYRIELSGGGEGYVLRDTLSAPILKTERPAKLQVPDKEIAARTPATVNLSGVWRGKYFYPNNSRNPVPFEIQRQIAGGELTGRASEPNTFGNPSARNLFADIRGTVRGDNFRFVKKYDGTGGQTHSVAYSGKIDRNTMTVEGWWNIGATRGKFEMRLGGH